MNPTLRAGAFGASFSILPLLFSTFVFADSSVTELDEVIVTANRVARTVDETMTAISIITREDIESIKAQDIIDILRLQPGVNISRTGGGGSSTTVFLRGSESDQVLVLLDGIRVSSATLGRFDWSNLPVDQVERIEVVRGSRTALYGSDAIGGVIQIFTRKNTGPYASFSVGKYDTKRASAGFSTGDKTRFSLNLSADRSDGFSATNAKNTFGFDPDKDGYDRKGVTLSLSHQLSAASKIGLDSFYSNNKADYDNGDTDSQLKTIGTYFESNISESWTQKFDIKHTNDHALFNSVFNSIVSTSTFETKRKEANWLHDISLSNQLDLLAGVNHREVSGVVTGSGGYSNSITNSALFSNLNYQQGNYNVDLAARYDNHSQAGSKWTGQLATGYQVTPSTNTYVSYGTAFKAPTINELYYPGFFGSFAGNPDLKPESSNTLELGIKTSIAANQRLEASLYRTRVSNLISFSGINKQAINNKKASMEGLELGYTGNSNRYDWGLNATFQNTKDHNTGKRLLRRPNSKLNVNLGYAPTSKTHLNLDATHASSRKDINNGLAAYTLLNLAVDQKLTKHLSVGLRVENVTDEEYELAYSYNTPGRAGFVTLSYK